MTIRTHQFTGIILCAIILLSGALAYEIASAFLASRDSSGVINRVNVGTPSSPLYFSYVVNIWMENKNCAGYLTSSGTPYEYSLSMKYAYDNCGFSDITSPSLPNYIGFLGGSYPSCATSDADPSSCSAGSQVNVVDRLETAGLTWSAYLQNYPAVSGCSGMSGSGSYYARHEPFLYFTDITSSSSRCARIFNSGGSAGSSADTAFLAALNQTSGWSNYVWFTPNGCNDEHDCGSSTGDAWLSTIVPKILNSNLFKTQNAALIINWDEYAPGPGPFFAGPAVKTGYVSTSTYNIYSLTATILDNWGLACLVNDCGKTPMSEFFGVSTPIPNFGLSPSPASVSFTVGSTTTSTLTLTLLGGFTGTVALTTSSPSGITATCSPTSLSATVLTSTCTFSASSAASGIVTITGTSGALTHSASIAVTATSSTSPDFGLSANPALVAFTAGGTGSSTITLSPMGGFTGTVTLTVSSPSGITTACIPGTVGGSSLTSTCTFSASSSTSGTVTVTGTSGSLTHSTSISVSATSSSGTGNFDPSQWTLSANSPSSSVISGGTLTETVIDTSSSFTGPFYATAQYGSNAGQWSCGSPCVTGMTTFSAHVNIATVNTVSSGYLYHAYMGLYFTLPSAVTAGGLTSSHIDGQVMVEQCSSNYSAGCEPAGYHYNSNLGNRFGFREILTTQGQGSSFDYVNFDIQAFCARAEAAWGIPSTPCTLVRVEPGIEAYGVNPFSVVWTTFYPNSGGNLPSFTITATAPPAVNVGSSAKSTVAIDFIHGFTGTVALTDNTLSGLNCGSITPTSFAANGSATISCSSSSASAYALTITGASGSITHTTTATFVFQDFSLSANPSSLSINAGASATSTVSLSLLGGFGSTVILNASSPTGLTSSLSTTSISGSATSTLTVSPAMVGSFTVLVTGTGGSLTRTILISVSVGAQVSPLLTAPATETVVQTSTVTFTVTTTQSAFPSRTLILSASGVPLGASFTTVQGISPISGTFRWTPTTSDSPGTYRVSFAVSDGVSTSQTYVVITVVSADVLPTITIPGPMNATVGGNLRFTISGNDPTGTGGTVILSATGLASNMGFDPTTGTFTFTPSQSQVGKTFTVNFTATDSNNPTWSKTESLPIHVQGTSAQPSGGGLCLSCLLPSGMATITWLVAIGALIGIVSSIALLHIRASQELAYARKRVRAINPQRHASKTYQRHQNTRQPLSQSAPRRKRSSATSN